MRLSILNQLRGVFSLGVLFPYYFLIFISKLQPQSPLKASLMPITWMVVSLRPEPFANRRKKSMKLCRELEMSIDRRVLMSSTKSSLQT